MKRLLTWIAAGLLFVGAELIWFYSRPAAEDIAGCYALRTLSGGLDYPAYPLPTHFRLDLQPVVGGDGRWLEVHDLDSPHQWPLSDWQTQRLNRIHISFGRGFSGYSFDLHN